MKRIVIAAVAAFAMLGAAQAQTQTQPSPFYGELGYTFLKLKEEGLSTRNGAIRGIFGYAFHPNIAVEGMLGFAVNDDSVTFVDPTFGPRMTAGNPSHPEPRSLDHSMVLNGLSRVLRARGIVATDVTI